MTAPAPAPTTATTLAREYLQPVAKVQGWADIARAATVPELLDAITRHSKGVDHRYTESRISPSESKCMIRVLAEELASRATD